MFTSKELLPEQFTHEQWNDYYALRVELYKKYDDPFVLTSIERFVNATTLEIKNGGFTIYIIYNDIKMIGYLRYWLTNKGHPTAQNNMVLSYVKEEYASKALEMCIANTLHTHMVKEIHYKAIWRGAQDFSVSLIKKISDLKSNSAHWFRLNPQQVSNELLNKWMLVTPESIGLRVEFHQYIPDFLIDELAPVVNNLINDMQRDDTSLVFNITAEQLRHNQQIFMSSETKTYHYFLFDEKEKIVALTVILISDFNPTVADQRITGVIKEWRGKGLAKWMKAQMIKKIKTDFPEIKCIKTECLTANHSMIKLNKTIGYELYKTGHDYYITPEMLNEFLAFN